MVFLHLQFVVLQNEGLGPILHLSQKMQMPQMLGRHEKPNSKEMKQLGEPLSIIFFLSSLICSLPRIIFVLTSFVI